MPGGLMLIAYDGSDNAKRAMECAGRFLAANRAVLVTAWEPMVRQAARMSGLSGVMQPEWVPDEETEDIAFSDAKVINEEGVQLAEAAGLDAEGACIECTSTIWTAIVETADELDGRHHRHRHPRHHRAAVVAAEQRRRPRVAPQPPPGADRAVPGK